TKATPWEPPTTLVYYNSPTKAQLDINQAATSVANVLTAMVLEMEEAMRSLGRASLKELSPNDLVALDSFTAEVTGVKSMFDSPIPIKPIATSRLKKQNVTSFTAEKQQCWEAVERLNSYLHYARRLIKLMENVINKLYDSKDLSYIQQLSTECNSLVREKVELDGAPR
ncbi:MAG TPA: FMN-binding glutamate synthase family protein, partial [Negativicutes bacterium]